MRMRYPTRLSAIMAIGALLVGCSAPSPPAPAPAAEVAKDQWFSQFTAGRAVVPHTNYLFEES